MDFTCILQLYQTSSLTAHCLQLGNIQIFPDCKNSQKISEGGQKGVWNNTVKFILQNKKFIYALDISFLHNKKFILYALDISKRSFDSDVKIFCLIRPIAGVRGCQGM